MYRVVIEFSKTEIVGIWYQNLFLPDIFGVADGYRKTKENKNFKR